MRESPERANPPAMLEAQQGGVERALVEIEQAARDLLNSLGQPEAVLRPHGFEGAQHHKVKRALQDIGLGRFCRHPKGVCAASIWMSRGSPGALSLGADPRCYIGCAWGASGFCPTR